MAIVFIDGFDFYSSTEAVSRGWNVGGNVMATGRFGGQAWSFTSTVVTRTRPLPSNYSTVIAGIACQFGTLPVANADFFTLQAGATLTCRVGLNSSNQIIIRNSGGTVVATGTTTIIANAWNYVEVKCVVNGASGSVEVHLNGVSGEIPSTTGNFGSTNIDTVGLSQVVNNAVTHYDDIYVADTTGSAPNNTFLGDVKVTTISPTGAGTHTQWSPLSAPNWGQVDETIADGDTSYNFDSTVGQMDTFPTGGISTSAVLFGVQTNLYAEKDNSGPRQISDIVRQGGTDYQGTTYTLGSNYLFYSHILSQDPTGSNWTAANLNADEFGYQLIA